MNYSHWFIAAVFVVTLGTAHAASAGGFGAPEGTIGVTEATFQKIKTAECTMDYCDPLIQRLEGEVIMRVEAGGALYRVMNDPGVPRILKYIPNGIYSETKKGESTGRTFYVHNGLKVRLNSGDMWGRVQFIAQDIPYMTIGITNATLADLRDTTDCSVLGSESVDSECVEASVARDELRMRLSGTILMNVEDGGALHYVRPDTLHKVYQLGPTVEFNEVEVTTISLEAFVEYAPTLLSKRALKNAVTIN